MSDTTTLPRAEQFRLDVDSLRAALVFHDLPACARALAARKGAVYAARALLALAGRLLREAKG